MSPEDVDALAASARTFLTTGYDCWDSDRVRRAARDLAQAVLDATPGIRRLQKKVADLEEAIRRQAAAVRMSTSARQQIDAHERKTLTSLAGQERAALLEELAAAREEASRWNATATQVEEERDGIIAAVREEQRARNVIATVPAFTAEFEQGVRDHREAATALKTVLSPYKKTRQSPRKEPPTMPEPVVSTQEDCAKHCEELAANCYAFARNVGMMGDHNEAIDARRDGDTYTDIARRIRAITVLTPKEPK